ncbi:YbaB/EbfC family nucleoid-associated protein [Saccharopolyspora sp. K220]|uniref:YbaB/EbfC family nucleoid-associated protein n=1 Tax=Saccharopolyspora soli TaxID=2926618 RepID=UPI001F5795AB|nr:YbaB/EbfC family nucleoid-associated protein [Saccharopolyspora soli]MCI2423759.1 YbaB/EbfC family nucleoid-associated protein [Saccharopolyspora soli]
MEAQFRIEESMDRLRRNLEKARQNPQAVLDGHFSGTSPSGAVTVWVDSLGRVERVRVAPGMFADGDEKLIADEFMAANTKARRAAENLDFDGAEEALQARATSVDEVDDYYDEPRSFLESGY